MVWTICSSSASAASNFISEETVGDESEGDEAPGVLVSLSIARGGVMMWITAEFSEQAKNNTTASV